MLLTPSQKHTFKKIQDYLHTLKLLRPRAYNINKEVAQIQFSIIDAVKVKFEHLIYWERHRQYVATEALQPIFNM